MASRPSYKEIPYQSRPSRLPQSSRMSFPGTTRPAPCSVSQVPHLPVDTKHYMSTTQSPGVLLQHAPNYTPRKSALPLHGSEHCPSTKAKLNLRPAKTPPKPSREFLFISENPANPEQKRKKLKRTDAQRIAAKSTREAGGSCASCSAKRKRCGPNNPCDTCQSDGTPCIRSASVLCLAPISDDNPRQLRLHPDTFQEARTVMDILKKNKLLDHTVFYTSVLIDWALCDKSLAHETIRIDDAKLDLHKLDLGLQVSLSEMAFRFNPIFVCPKYSGPLHENLHQVVKFLAAIYQLSQSSVSVPPVALGLARMIVFYLMTIYMIGLCGASLRFANEFLNLFRNKRLNEHSVLDALSMYSQAIGQLLSFQHHDSLLSSIFTQIRPLLQARLDTIQNLELFLSSILKDNLDRAGLPDFSRLQPLNLGIALEYEGEGSLPTASSRQEMGHEQWCHRVKFLLSNDFYEDVSATNAYNVNTIDPRKLRLSQSSKFAPASSTQFNSHGTFNSIFTKTGTSRSTDLTYPSRDETAQLSPWLEGSANNDNTITCNYTALSSEDEDYLNIGSIHEPFIDGNTESSIAL